MLLRVGGTINNNGVIVFMNVGGKGTSEVNILGPVFIDYIRLANYLGTTGREILEAAGQQVPLQVPNPHLMLDFLGMYPGIGEFFDSVNGVYYLIEGDFTNAGICFLSLVPLGEVLKIGKIIKRVDNVSSVAVKSAARLTDGMKATSNQALGLAEDFLGQGYKEIAPGVFRSKDGLRQVRMTANDLNDIRGAHFNFETGITTTTHNGRETFKVSENIHVFITDGSVK